MSSESEEVVVAAILQDNTRVEPLTGLIKPEDFHDAKLGKVFAKAVALCRSGEGADVFTVAEDDGEMLAYLGRLVTHATTANSETHARRVRDAAIKRRVIQHGQDLIDLATSRQATAEDCVARISQHATSLLVATDQQGPMSLGQAMPHVVDDLERRLNGEVHNVKTHYTNIDNITGGFEGGDLILLAGRPAMGKTTLAMNIAVKVAAKGGCPFVFSMEMPTRQLIYRLAGGLAGVDVSKFRSGRFTDAEWAKIMPALRKIESLPMVIDDTSRLSVGEMRTRLRRARHERPIDLVVVDYLGLISGTGDTRRDQVSDISAGLKAIAREFDVPLIALSQLNRGVENRENKRPMPSDLRDSGTLEQDADSIMMVYRDIVYDVESPFGDYAEVIINKNRHGGTGTCWFVFDGAHNKFTEAERPEITRREPETPETSSFRKRVTGNSRADYLGGL